MLKMSIRTKLGEISFYPNRECAFFFPDMLPTSSKLRAVSESIIIVPSTCVYRMSREEAANLVLSLSSACLNKALAAESA